MSTEPELSHVVLQIEKRLAAIDQKLDHLTATRRKSMEWIATMSEHVQSLDAFREEVRASLEPLFDKLQHLDETIRIMHHATADVARRVDDMEGERRKAG